MRVSLEIPRDCIKFVTNHDSHTEIVLEEDNSKFPQQIIDGLESLDLTDDELVVVEKSVSAVLSARRIKSWIKIKE